MGTSQHCERIDSLIDIVLKMSSLSSPPVCPVRTTEQPQQFSRD